MTGEALLKKIKLPKRWNAIEELCEELGVYQQEVADATDMIDPRHISRTKLGSWPRDPDAFVLIAIGFNRVLARNGNERRVTISDLLKPLERAVLADEQCTNPKD